MWEGKVSLHDDVAAFANTEGGYLVYGVDEEKKENGEKLGCAGTIAPFEIEDPDQHILRLQNSIRDSLEPSIDCRIKKIPYKNTGKYFIVIYVPKSLVAPHRIKSTNKFYYRTSNGNALMDISQLRNAFLLSSDWEKRIDNFRADRLIRIRTQQITPNIKANEPLTVIHFIPVFSFLKKENRLNLEKIKSSAGSRVSLINSYMGSSGRFNIDGYFQFYNGTGFVSYNQFFSNGIIESVDTRIIGNAESEQIPSDNFKIKIEKIFNEVIDFYKQIDIDLDFYFYVSMFNIKNKYILKSTNNKNWYYDKKEHVINNSEIHFSSIKVDKSDINLDGDTKTILKPLFDQLYQAANYLDCED